MKLSPHTLALSALSLFASATFVTAQPTQYEDHILGRYGYGQDAWSLKRFRDLGRKDYLEEQLSPSTIADPVMRQAYREPQFDAMTMSLPTLNTTFRAKLPRRPSEVHRQVQRAMLLRTISSRRQLQALMTEFWFNHFNVDLGGQSQVYLVGYVDRTIKNRVFGKFEDLLLATAKSPAMLKYLDNRVNFKKGFKRGATTYDINENYAREVMELHTFGVTDQAGIYAQKDIIALARALTGWTTDNTVNSGFRFIAGGHDTGAKTIVKLNLPAGGGVNDGERALRYLARHPRTASFIAAKMVRFLVGPGQTDLVKRARQKFLDSKGNLRAVTRLILGSAELNKARDLKIKRPTLLVASALRAVGAKLGDCSGRETILNRVRDFTAAAGLPLFEVPPPTGWTDAPKSFLSAGTMLERANRLQALLGAATPQVTMTFNPARSSAAATTNVIAKRVLSRISVRTRDALIGYWNASAVPTAQRGRATLVLALLSNEFARY